MLNKAIYLLSKIPRWSGGPTRIIGIMLACSMLAHAKQSSLCSSSSFLAHPGNISIWVSTLRSPCCQKLSRKFLSSYPWGCQINKYIKSMKNKGELVVDQLKWKALYWRAQCCLMKNNGATPWSSPLSVAHPLYISICESTMGCPRCQKLSWKFLSSHPCGYQISKKYELSRWPWVDQLYHSRYADVLNVASRKTMALHCAHPPHLALIPSIFQSERRRRGLRVAKNCPKAWMVHGKKDNCEFIQEMRSGQKWADRRKLEDFTMAVQ